MSSLEEEILKIHQIEDSKIHLRMSEYYGMDNILKEYLQLPTILPLKYTVYLEHGISIMPDYINLKLQEVKNELIFVNTSHRKKYLEKHLSCQVEVLGPLAIHFRRMKGIVQSEKAEGTLIFPSHSSHHADSVFDWEKYADSLLSFPDALRPLKICLYWKDFLLERQHIFLDRGFEVTTNGHLYDKEHVAKIYKNIREAKFLSGNSISSAFFYGLEMGIPAFVYGDEVILKASEKKYETVKNKSDNKYLAKAYKVLQRSDFKQEISVSEEIQKLRGFYIDEEHWISVSKARKLAMNKLIPSLVKKGLSLMK